MHAWWWFSFSITDLVPCWWNRSFSNKTLHEHQRLMMSVTCERECSSLFFLLRRNRISCIHSSTSKHSLKQLCPLWDFVIFQWFVDKLKRRCWILLWKYVAVSFMCGWLNYFIMFAFVVVSGNLTRAASCLILLAVSGWCVENLHRAVVLLFLSPANKKGKTPPRFCPLNRCWWNWHLTFCLHVQTNLRLNHELCTTNWKNKQSSDDAVIRCSSWCHVSF